MGYHSFEALEVYKAARQFRIKVYNLIKQLPNDEKYNLAGQMRRAALSLTNNIAEGHGRFSYQENIQFCRISRGSLMELIDDLNACVDEKYFEVRFLEELKIEGYKINKMLNGYISYLKKRKREIPTDMSTI
ncbi:MAG: four helix bundle protein [Desulfobacterales bacterium]